MLRSLDRLLERITMYRLVLYYLIALVVLAIGLSMVGIIQYSPLAITASALFLAIVCQVTNLVFAYVFETPTNVESAYITALILALIITPLNSLHNVPFLAAAGGLAIASKYILAVGKKHIFNPAAIAVVLTAFGPLQSASWWVGNTALLPLVVLGGVLIVRKIQRGWMVLCFFAAAAISTLVVALLGSASALGSLQSMALHSSLFFLAFVMLTEPLTSPGTINQQLIYGALVGLLFSPQIHIAGVYSTPELALVIGNLYSYIVSPKVKIALRLTQKVRTSSHTADFIFSLKRPIRFKPGQYMEWTFGHEHPDSRGNRRYFTLASSPTEPNIRVGIKFYPEGSSYKKALLALDSSTPIIATQLSGDFVLPRNARQKLAFVAGGIGVTPYRSMVKYLLDTNQRRDIIFLYSEKRPTDFVYADIFNAATQQFGLQAYYAITNQSTPNDWQGLTGRITPEMIQQVMPDYRERLFYISGPHDMVVAVRAALLTLGLSHSCIKTDFFSGY
jgi:ferredoxin-NADP reductase/Na+-translocating ferredoxin:NAD+ oxidoreductase RnfD subunit